MRPIYSGVGSRSIVKGSYVVVKNHVGFDVSQTALELSAELLEQTFHMSAQAFQSTLVHSVNFGHQLVHLATDRVLGCCGGNTRRARVN